MADNCAAVTVESLDHEGRGIAHAEGKVIFIEGALTGERVTYNSYRKKPSYEQAHVVDILKQSFMRVQPKCSYFGVCGGCSMQHLEPRAQVAVKQRVLEDNLARIGKVKPETILPPIYGMPWGYRQRARLSVRHVLKKGKTLIGFREKNGKYVTDMRYCEILTPTIARLLPLLGELNESFTARDMLPQIEVAVGERVDVLVLRILQALSPSDEAAIKQFADTHRVQFWTQTKGPETVEPFYPLDAPALTYSLPEFDIEMPFAPTEFTQVNNAMNRLMVSRALRLLDPQPNERIADFFCGLGNFTLPIARRGAQVLGIEGSPALVKRAQQNAGHNGLAGNAKFAAMNLFEIDGPTLVEIGSSFSGEVDSRSEDSLLGDHSRNLLASRVTCHDRPFDKWLVDPPRDGAMELVKAIGDNGPRRIVYVSCNPATLARDAEVLVHVKGYTLAAAGVMNMFPQTSHVESIAVFDKMLA